MNNSNENKTDETSRQVFNKTSLRYVKQDLSEIMAEIDRVANQLQDRELQLSLENAWDDVEHVYNEITDREDKVDALIKTIAE